MGLFRRLRRVTTGAVRQRVKQVFSRGPDLDDPDQDAAPSATPAPGASALDAARREAKARAQAARPAPPTTADPVPPPEAAPPPEPAAGPAETVQVTKGPGGRRSL